MRKKFSYILSLVLIMSLALTGCFTKDTTQPSTQPGGNEQTAPQGEGDKVAAGPKILRLNNSSEPGSLHPALAKGTHDSWVLTHTFEGLTKKAQGGGVEAGMAKDWKVSDDGLTYTFNLRDANWSNGDPVTAEDFVVAWKHALNPHTASEYAYQLYYIKGGEAYNTAPIGKEGEDKKALTAEELKALEDAVGVKALDEKTLEVTLEQPVPYFLELTAFYTYYPINKNVQASNPDWAKDASTFVSNGAFKLTKWAHKSSIELTKNENYYDKDRVKLDGIHFSIVESENTAWQMYVNGEIDMAYPLPGDVVPKLVAENNPDYHLAPYLGLYYYNFNTTVKPFNNVKVRKALAMAIDRDAIVTHITQGGQLPAYGIVPPGIPDLSGDFQANTGNLFKEDYEEAKRLLAEGLEEEGMDKLSFVLLYNTHDGHKKIAEAVQEMWRKNLGVEITLENVEFQVKLDRESALDFQVSRAGWIADYVDPMSFMDLWVTDGGHNDTGWGNAEYDRLIKEAKSTMDQNVRMKNMHEAEKIAMDELPIMPIYFYTKPFAIKPYVTGYFTPADMDAQFHYADIQK